MKIVTAIIQPDALHRVREALIAADITRITVTRVTGHGQMNDKAQELYRGQAVHPDLISKVRMDIACNDNFVEPAIQAILASARHSDGEVGDGKIFVTPCDECIRIRTGERGGTAI